MLKKIKLKFISFCSFLILILANNLSAKELSIAYKNALRFTLSYENPNKDSLEKPNILIIGDSIANDYSKYLRYLISESHDVYKYDNDRYTDIGLLNINEYLKKRNWDLILFNFGLHDLLRINKDKKRNNLIKYKKNLYQIVGKLKKSNASLIWLTTTPVPEKTPNRVANSQKEYNEISKNIMKNYGIKVCDIEDFLNSSSKISVYQKFRDVHLTEEGSLFIAHKIITKCM